LYVGKIGPVSASASVAGSVSTPGFLVKYQALLQAALRASLASGAPPLGTMLRYHMGWETPEGVPVESGSGKGLRPALCFFTCEAVGGATDAAMPAAVALELIHNFSLIHDDIQDQDTERHGRQTVWTIWGRPKALVAGNTMRTYADAMLYQLQESGTTPEKTLEVLRVLTERCLELIEGQYMDLNFEARLDVTPDEYLDMVSRKTGALVEAAMHLGAVLGGAESSQVDALARCGRLLGLAFQARDDVLGIWGDTTLMGKATGADIRRKKKSLPVVYGFTQASKGQRQRLEQLYSTTEELGDDAVDDVMGILDDLDAHGFAQSVAEEMEAKAIATAKEAELAPEAAASLEDLANFMVHRDH